MATEAQKRAVKNWDNKNRERKRYLTKRSTVRSFIKNMNDEDIPEFVDLINERQRKSKKTLDNIIDQIGNEDIEREKIEKEN